MHFSDNIIREGVELTKNSSEIAKKRGLIIHQSKLEEFNFDKKYEVVTAYAILEHLSDPLSFLHKINKIIDENGVLVIAIPTYQCVKQRLLSLFGKRWHMYSPPEHLFLYSRKFIERYFKDENFIIKKKYYISGGMFNPFRKIRIFGYIFTVFMRFIDNSIINKLPIFDHLFYVFRKK